MVHGIKNSQDFMTWCVCSALGLIYNAVEKLGDNFVRSDIDREFRDFHPDLSSRQISGMVYELKRSKYIEIDEGDSVKLTNKAKIKIIDRIADAKINDGKLRLVSFDIPETKRASRNNFRRAIKRMGFRQVQKSLWASSRNVGDLVDIVAAEYKVTDYIAYFVAERSNIDHHIADVLNKSKPELLP